jgi:hypothetical protein
MKFIMPKDKALKISTFAFSKAGVPERSEFKKNP